MKRVWLTIREAAARHKSPRDIIDAAIKRGSLPSRGTGKNRRVRIVDVDALPAYVPRPPLPEVVEDFEFRLTPEEVAVLSYSLTVAVILDRLIGAEPEIVRGLQVRFGTPDEWTVWIPEEGA